jgi:hypothetical protein
MNLAVNVTEPNFSHLVWASFGLFNGLNFPLRKGEIIFYATLSAETIILYFSAT